MYFLVKEKSTQSLHWRNYASFSILSHPPEQNLRHSRAWNLHVHHADFFVYWLNKCFMNKLLNSWIIMDYKINF